MSQDIARKVASGYLLREASALTPDIMTRQIESQLGARFNDWAFKVYTFQALGSVSILIDFCQAPKTGSNTILWNAPKYIRVSISSKDKWAPNSPAPQTLRAEVLRSRGVDPFRKKTGPSAKILQSVIDWFKAHEKDLTGI